MTNEQYLIVSYFLVAATSLVIGFVAYAWLRSPFNGVAAALPWKGMRDLLVRLFPIGILFPALIGFISVEYKGCNKETYAKVIADRSYLVGKNQEQISSSLDHVAWAVVGWALIVAILLIFARRSESTRRDVIERNTPPSGNS